MSGKNGHPLTPPPKRQLGPATTPPGLPVHPAHYLGCPSPAPPRPLGCCVLSPSQVSAPLPTMATPASECACVVVLRPTEVHTYFANFLSMHPYCRPRREGLLSQPSSVQRTSKITPCLDPNPTYQHMLSRKLFQLFRPPASLSMFCGEPPNSLAKLLEPMF